MLVKQVSVFLENSKGRLFDVSDTLAKNNINISGISLADTTDYGILRLVVADPIKAQEILKANDFIVELTDVIAILIEDTPGGMAKAFEQLSKKDVSVEYLYAVSKLKDNFAVLVFKTDDHKKAIEALQEGGIKIIKREEFYSL